MTVKSKIRIGTVRLPHSEGLDLPTYETDGASGMDLRAAIEADMHLVLEPGQRALVPTGLVFEMTSGLEAQIRPRSGLAFKHGVTCLNAPGTIDSDFRGEVQVLLINHGSEPFEITRGMRIAQIVFATVTRVTLEDRDLGDETKRGKGGFGSTGMH